MNPFLYVQMYKFFGILQKIYFFSYICGKQQMMAEKNETGKKGEAIACSYLEICGFSILHTNWRFRRFELDIVATNGSELVIVEVKTRSKNCLLDPEKSIDRYKIRRITAAADAYIRKYGIDLPVRFDVLCLIKDEYAYTVEKHFEDAFFAPMINQLRIRN